MSTPQNPETAKPNTAPQSASKRMPYLMLRGQTYYFKRKIPAGCAEAFPDFRGEVWRSLHTQFFETAKIRLAVEVTEFELTVAEFRRLRAVKESDANLPTDPSPWLRRRGRRRNEPAPTPPAELPPAELERLALIRSLEEGLERLRRLTAIPEGPVVMAAAVQTPDVPTSAAPASETALQASAREPATATGAPTSTEPLPAPQPRKVLTLPRAAQAPDLPHSPAVPAAAPPPKPVVKAAPVPRKTSTFVCTLLHLFEAWKRTQTRERSIRSVQSAVMAFRELHGAVAVDDISRQMVRDFRDKLIESGLSQGTIENRIGFLATLVRYGMREMVEHLPRNPFEGIPVEAPVKGKTFERRAYEISELNRIFASRLYTDGYRPSGQSREAAYWLPLLGPFVGARIEELCQMRISDVQCINGSWCLRICNLGEDQKLKNLGSFRRVPLHEELIKVGFLAYVASVATAPDALVFPSLENDNQNQVYSNSPGKWFGRYLDSIGLKSPSLDYHSYRYTFKQQASLCDMDNETRDALTGHWLNKSDAGRTYMKAENRQYPYQKLVAAMSRLRYDELKLSHLYVADPMAGVEDKLLR